MSVCPVTTRGHVNKTPGLDGGPLRPGKNTEARDHWSDPVGDAVCGVDHDGTSPTFVAAVQEWARLLGTISDKDKNRYAATDRRGRLDKD
jgi:hypothetical protein